MSYESRAYDRQNTDGFPPDPVVVLVVEGTHDVSRLIKPGGGGMTAVEPGLFPEPEHVEPMGDGPWMVGPAPRRWRYMYLTARADPDDAERRTPGWFPVTVVDLEA